MHSKQMCVAGVISFICATSVLCQKTAVQKIDNSQLSLTGDVVAYCLMSSTPIPSASLYTINSDGTENKLLLAANIGLNHLDWSPDGKNFVAVGYMDATYTTWSLHTFAADGTNLKRITSTNGVADTEPAWSPDGLKIAFTRIFWSVDGRFETSRTELWVMNFDGSGQQYIGIEGFASKWSPDGTKFIYSSKKSGNYEIYTCLINGTSEQRLTNTSAHETYPVWSPDGTQIAFCTSTGIYNSQEATVTYEVYLINADGTSLRQLTNNSSHDGNPRWSPDGTRLAFNSDRSSAEHIEVYIMNTDGSNIQRVTNTPEAGTAINPVWCPATTTHVLEEVGSIPGGFQLFQNYPNPFNPTTTIRYELTRSSQIKLCLYDFLGREVRTLIDEHRNPGRYNIRWDGTDKEGNQVASGIYLIRLTDGNFIQSQKAFLLK